MGTQDGGRVREGLSRESQAGEKYDPMFLALYSITEKGTLFPLP